jgi:O-6-methylguanine DNA methyltransferase
MIAKSPETEFRVSVFDSELGWMALLESSRGVSRLTFAHAGPTAALEALKLNTIEPGNVSSTGPLVRRLRAFAQGRFDDFLDVPVDCFRTDGGRQTQFQQRVVAACRAIAPGETRSYGELAAAVGAPRAARAVGSVMSGNRIAILIPCHRVLRSGGKLGGYSLGQGLPLKRELLELEGRMQAAGKPGRFDANHAAALGCESIGAAG